MSLIQQNQQFMYPSQDNSQMSQALHEAVRSNNYNVAKALLLRGANPNSIGSLNLPLIFESLYNNNEHMFQLLLDFNANIQQKDYQGCNLLHYATILTKPNMAIVKKILDIGVDVNAFDDAKYTPLHYAVFNENHFLVDLFLRYNANINLINDANEIPFMCIQRNTLNIQIADLS